MSVKKSSWNGQDGSREGFLPRNTIQTSTPSFSKPLPPFLSQKEKKKIRTNEKIASRNFKRRGEKKEEEDEEGENC